MSEIEKLTQKLLKFRQERDWEQFHNPKDQALSLSLEAAELLELFQWKTPEQSKKFIQENKDAVADELADVLSWVLYMSHDFGIDIADAFKKKLAKNEKKYTLEKAKGVSTKYTEF